MDQKGSEYLDDLHLAEAAALLAGHSLRDRQVQWCGLEQQVGHDIKIKADRMAEQLIVDHLQLGRREYPILSEEAGRIGKWNGHLYDNPYWIIDPLDGSLNYHQGIPFCCVSIALFKAMQPILGVVYNFNRNELYTGLTGEGAWLNHVSIQTSKTQDVSKAVLATGFPVQTDFSSPSLAQFIIQIQQFRKVRLLGSAALSLSHVARGSIDVYREDNIMLWDVAGGCALVSAAGGSVNIDPADEGGVKVDVIASNGYCNPW